MPEIVRFAQTYGIGQMEDERRNENYPSMS